MTELFSHLGVPARVFEDTPSRRDKVPLLIGLFGPSSSGKTFSALRLATGIQRVSGGDIFVIDTESRRALHYADLFNFRHIDFRAPFGSLDYLAALQHCAAKNAGVIVIDSMSHEHDGVGGYLQLQEAELTRIAGDDEAKRRRATFLAWKEPSQRRRRLINGILQMNTNFVFCFRAKEKLKIVPGANPIELGFMPIAGDEFLYEMTVAALLLPGAGGVPTWHPQMPGERLMVKVPEQFRKFVKDDGPPLDEAFGAKLADWARGNEELPSAPKLERKPTFPEWMMARADEGMASLNEAVARVREGTNQARIEWVDERWPLLLERAERADAPPPEDEP
jgi:AAA domain